MSDVNGAAPSLTLLIKLLKMTTSSHENEALVAMRKANTELTKFGGDWESLLRGKVTVIGDPFADLTKPDVGQKTPPRPQAPPPPPPPSRNPYTSGLQQPQPPRQRPQAAAPQRTAKPSPQPKAAAPTKPPAWSNAPKPGSVKLEELI